MTQIRKFKTIALAKTQIFEPDQKVIASSSDVISKSIGKKINQQDLLYTKSVLVTTGINGNDDVFLIDEMWKARHSPILKPQNWMHNDTNIIGVMYSAEPYDLNGKHITANQWDDPFEIVVEGVVYKLTFPDKAKEIEARAKSNELFVSMEAWFDSYDYAFFKDGKFNSLIQKDSSTSFIDAHLRSKGGTGIIEVDKEKFRVGRALRNLTFGGNGFVFVPANDRSLILEVGDSNKDSAVVASDGNDIESYLKPILCAQAHNKLHGRSIVVFSSVKKEENVMPHDIASNLTVGDLHNVLDEREKAKASIAEVDALRVRAEQVTAEKEKLSQANAELAQANEALKVEKDVMAKAVDKLVDELTEALAEAPPEIARIDKVTDGDSAFDAKIAWIKESTASLLDQACVAAKLEKELAEAKILARSKEVADLFGSLKLTEAQLKVLQNKASKMSDDEYMEWFAEKQLIVKAGESYAQPDLGNDVQNGKGPGSFPKTPMHKISGGKTESAEDVLSRVEVEKVPNLTGASNSTENTDKNPVLEETRSLAAYIYEGSKPRTANKKSDPVEK